jgi:myo-inositol-1(or 4)-monophosphatase
MSLLALKKGVLNPFGTNKTVHRGCTMDLTSLLEEVKKLIVETSALMDRKTDLEVKAKGARDFVTQVDLRISELLCQKLPKLLPGSVVLSEEGEQFDGPRAEFTWIIDPVDGTTNFIYGLPLYAISAGLLQGEHPVLGVVYNPTNGEMFSATLGGGAFLGSAPIRVNTDVSLAQTLVLAETDPYLDRRLNSSPELIKAVFQDCIDYRVTGSAALDICYIAAGRAGVFFTQALKPWDYAGGSSILLEAGGNLSMWDGNPVPYTGTHNFLASNKLLHTEMLEKIRKTLR